MWISRLPSKDAAAITIKNIQAIVKRKSDKKLLMLRTNRGREFAANNFINYCTQLGVRR
jgi:hypothetical protein